jgi:hypothetical protein
MNICGVELEQTCGACPEQYDAFVNKKQVGYLRLRYGHFSVYCPDHRGEEVYSAQPRGDGLFEDDEREEYLTKAAKAIQDWILKQY